MSTRAAFARVAASPSLRFVTGSTIYGAYIESPAAIATNAAAALIIGAMNFHSERAGNFQFLVNGIVCMASAVIATSDAVTRIGEQGMNLENWGRLSIGLAYASWACADAMLLRWNLKNIETADKKYLDPAIPNGIADVLATGSFPPLMLTTAAAIYKQTHETPVAEDAKVSTKKEFFNKHCTGNRLLAMGMLAAGIAGAATGLGPLYAATFALWTAGYVAFEPKRNAAVVPDWKSLPRPK